VAVQIVRYKCEHCKKHFSNKKYAESHERRCFFNRNNKACPSCTYFNNCYKVENCKCSLTGRKGTDKIINPNIGEYDFFADKLDDIQKINQYNVLTEFIKYNCPDWDDGFDEDYENYE
jgi:hypothetical protein